MISVQRVCGSGLGISFVNKFSVYHLHSSSLLPNFVPFTSWQGDKFTLVFPWIGNNSIHVLGLYHLPGIVLKILPNLNLYDLCHINILMLSMKQEKLRHVK